MKIDEIVELAVEHGAKAICEGMHWDANDAEGLFITKNQLQAYTAAIEKLTEEKVRA